MLRGGSKNVSVTTKNVECLTELADATVQGDAKKEVDTANKKAEKAEASAKAATKLLEAYQKDARVDTQNAIEKAEKVNLGIIAQLRKDLKVKQAQLELNDEAHKAASLEADLALETLDAKNSFLEKQIALLQQNPKNIIEKVTANFRNYWGMRRLHRQY